MEELKNKQFSITRQVAKKDWIKTSFWMPENTPDMPVEEMKEPPAKAKLECPFSKQDSHKIKIKELVKIKL